MNPHPEHNTAPKVINGRINGKFAPGVSGNPGGSPEATRRAVNKAFLQDMRKAWDKLGMKALEKCAKNQPAAFCKMYVLLVPREMKVEHSPGVASLTDEQIETAIAAIRQMLDQREKALDAGQLIEGKAEPVALPASGQGAQGER
jgi:hypothetical protein